MQLMPILIPYVLREQAKGLPRAVPMSLLDEDTAWANHAQTLATLAARGGMSPMEIMLCHRRQSIRGMLAPGAEEAGIRDLLQALSTLPKENP